MTLKELSENLNLFLEKYPEFSDKEVSFAAECGYSGAGIEDPFTIAIPVNEKGEYYDFVKIVSTDDGFRTNPYLKEWKFFELNN